MVGKRRLQECLHHLLIAEGVVVKGMRKDKRYLVPSLPQFPKSRPVVLRIPHSLSWKLVMGR